MEKKIRNTYIRSCVNDDLKPLFDLVGQPMFKKVLADCGSGQHHFPDLKSYNRYGRDFDIYDKYMKGASVKRLAADYRLSESEVRKIVKKVGKALMELGVSSVLEDE